MSPPIEVIPQSGALGAEIRGTDLSKSLDNETWEVVHRAFLDHQVIFLRDQDITPADEFDFAQRFGTPSDYPLAEGLPDFPQITPLVKEPHETFNFGGEWHSDTSYLEVPPLATILYAKEVPVSGGDTIFANMYQACEELSDGMKALLEGQRAIYSAGLLRGERLGGYASIKYRNVDRLDEMFAEHPVVRTHPETGRKSLYLSSTHTSHFVDMTREESLPLITHLSQQSIRPELTFRLRWEVGTVTVWDNRCTNHYAINDYTGHRRVTHRVTVTDGRPV